MDNFQINKLLKSEFIRNILTLLSGATLAQVITFISIPILTRIYNPEDFGYIATYLSICNILATIASGRYELAIMLPKDKKVALAIIKGTFKLIFWVSIFTLILTILLKNSNNKFSELLKPDYFYFIPLSTFIFAIVNVLTQWLSRNKKFKLQASSKIVQSGTSNVTNIAFGFTRTFKYWGLFLGHIAGQLTLLFFLMFPFLKNEKQNMKTISRDNVKLALKENKSFPLYSAPMGVLNLFSVDVLIYTFNLFFSTTMVGLYSNANKVINYPLNLISQSFMSVFYQKISETQKKLKLYIISYFSNLTLATIMLIPVILWGEELFSFFLGQEWEMAGSIAKFLAP